MSDVKKVALISALVAALVAPSCMPWKKKPKPKEETKKELEWAWSRPRRTTPRSAVTYTRRPYVAPRAEAPAPAPKPAPSPPPIYLGRFKYKVVVMEFAEGEGASEFKGIGKRAAEELASLLEASDGCVVVDLKRLQSPSLDDPEGLWRLWRSLGVHGVVRGTVQKAMVGEDKGGALALVEVEAVLLSTETGGVIKGAYGQNPLYLSRTQGPARRLKALEKALKAALEEVRDGLLLGLGQLEWNTSVASVEGGTVYLNAGRRSGLKIGEFFDVYAPGPLVRNPLSGAAIGRAPGERKARVKVEGFFGLDASRAVVVEGGGVEPGDVARPSRVKKGL